ncbi:MAG: hypothetical protein IJD97_10070 [Clostridia bacterium]|nr:hypothetical protein [Clostridia bacterium]
MIVVKDYTVEDSVVVRLTGCEKFSVISASDEVPENLTDNFVVFVTDLPVGILGYHANFFNKNKNTVKNWIVIILNKNKITINHAKICFFSPGVRVSILTDTDTPEDIQIIRDKISSAEKVKSKTALIYSIRPDCEKGLLKELLKKLLPDWTFETASEVHGKDILYQTTVSHVIIVGKTMEDFRLPIPAGIIPFYVQTKVQENVQSYLKKDMLAENLVHYIPESLSMTSESAKKLYFFISPLYELWRLSKTDPRLDCRFVMWDEFGLPLSRSEYNAKACRSFLDSFNESEKLVQSLKE